MSCYIVSNEIVSHVVSGLVDLGLIKETDSQATLDEMMLLNSSSVSSRYSSRYSSQSETSYVFEKIETDLEKTAHDLKSYRAVLNMLSKISEYVYNSCECENFSENDVAQIITNCRETLLNNARAYCVQIGHTHKNNASKLKFYNLPLSSEY